MKNKDLSYLQISRSALRHNIKAFRRLAGKKVLIAPAVKANAYGHGLIGAAKIFAVAGADWLCVNSVAEAVILRKAGIKKPILLIGRFIAADINKILAANVRIFIDDYGLAKKVSAAAAKKNQIVPFHLKIDTGMGRQGIAAGQAPDFIKKISRLPNLKIEGLATHFANADEPCHPAHFLKQFNAFNKSAVEIEKFLGRKLIKHCANSAAAMIYSASRFDLIRPGIAAYGLYPSSEVKKIWEKNQPPLCPTLSFKTRITLIKIIKAGDCISYGCTFKAKKRMKLALLPVGYYDGLDRRLSNAGSVLIRGQACPILGRVCMDLTVVDISKIKNARLGDEAVIIGRQGGRQITADNLAGIIGTINYEVVTRLREGLVRYYTE